jgi:hypothetical protein
VGLGRVLFGSEILASNTPPYLALTGADKER